MGTRAIGIDEAGRGPVIGPLVIAGVSIGDKVREYFKEIGVKDSKMLSMRRIFQLAPIIKKHSLYDVIIKSAKEIDDRFSSSKNLNYLELNDMAKIANELKGEKVIVDSPSANTEAVRKYLSKLVKDKEIIARNYADRDFIEVGAASIIAKATRETEIKKIKELFEYDFGSGYPSDPLTKKFLLVLQSTGKLDEYPYKEYIRKTWFTIKNLKNVTLDKFI